MTRFTDFMLFLSPSVDYSNDTLQTLNMGRIVSVSSSMYGFSPYFCFIVVAVIVVALLFYVDGKHLRSCRDGQLT